MNFDQAQFWILLASGISAVVVLRVALARARIGSARTDRIALAVLNLSLLFAVHWLTFAIFAAVVTLVYATARWLSRLANRRARRVGLCALIPVQLAPLLYYKYGNFLANEVLGANVDVLRHLIIPIGLSFYTFQTIGFLLDTLARNEPVPAFLDYLNFASFFPQIVAGPIERKRDLLPQMETFRFRWLPAEIDRGASWIVVGLLFKLMIANNVAQLMQPLLSSDQNPFTIWAANILFGLRIYFDFAGYSLIALGLGHVFGIRLTLNFSSPYVALNIQEFWRRWHISLSNWFRDYVYIPLGGGRSSRWVIAVAVVFVLSGLWHGAGWNFVMWGALHGTYLILFRLIGQRISIPRAVAWVCTLLLVFFAWLPFYETRTAVLSRKMGALLTPKKYTSAALTEALQTLPSAEAFTLFAVVLVGRYR